MIMWEDEKNNYRGNRRENIKIVWPDEDAIT